jgi:DNA-binding transcriptional ArsR family regulator
MVEFSLIGPDVMEHSDNFAPENNIHLFLKAAKDRRAFSGCQDIFGDPAFEILLALRLYQDKGLDCIDDVIQAVDLPEENIIRWLTVLENAELVAQESEAIRLTRRALAILDTTNIG